MSRRLLNRGRFASTDEFKKRILEFIEFFNRTLAKPFRWTFIGRLYNNMNNRIFAARGTSYGDGG